MIYTSNTEISSYDLKRLLRNKVQACKPGTKIVVLYGIHGYDDGRHGKEDENLVRSFSLAIEQIKKERLKEIEEKRIWIKGVILKRKSEKSLENHDEVIQALRDANMLVISYCFTNVNVLNSVLRSEGMYAELILSSECSEILSNGKLIKLDLKQKQILDEYIADCPHMVILIGHYGTGKTLMIVQMLGIRIGNLIQEGVQQIKIFVTANVSENSLLLEDLKVKYLSFIENINKTREEKIQIEVVFEPLITLIKKYKAFPDEKIDRNIYKKVHELFSLDENGWMRGNYPSIETVILEYFEKDEERPPNFELLKKNLKHQSRYDIDWLHTELCYDEKFDGLKHKKLRFYEEYKDLKVEDIKNHYKFLSFLSSYRQKCLFNLFFEQYFLLKGSSFITDRLLPKLAKWTTSGNLTRKVLSIVNRH